MANTSKHIKFFSKELLHEANNAAHREKRRCCIDPKLLESFSNNFIYFIEKFFYHKRNELRLFILTNEDGHIERLDVSVKRYDSLPEIIFFEDNTYNVKINARPYPNNRQWQETETIKPVRNQAKFRRKVLDVYNHNCAVCNIKEVALLRAAHIIDVKDGGTDNICNGICLCVNHEIAFDRGLLQILPDYKIEYSENIDTEVNYLKLPTEQKNYPAKSYLEFKLRKLGKFND